MKLFFLFGEHFYYYVSLGHMSLLMFVLANISYEEPTAQETHLTENNLSRKREGKSLTVSGCTEIC